MLATYTMYCMRNIVHVQYHEAVNDVPTVDYESSEIDGSLNGGFYTVLGSLATLETSSLMHMAEFNPDLSIIGQHIGATEALAAIATAGFFYGLDKVWNSIKAIHQQITDSRVSNPVDVSQTSSLSKTLSVQMGIID